jgi:TM2 domain-containing membrane protein YozV
MYQPAYQPPMHRPMSETMRGMVSDTLLALGIGIGLVLTWIGAVIWGLVDDADADKVGMFLRALGMLVLTGVLFLGGVLRHDMDKWIRWMLILSATLLLIFIGFWTNFWSALGISIGLPFA